MHAHLQLVLRYMDIFYGEKDPQKLENLLDEKLVFEGPFFSGQSSQQYIDSLIEDPPMGCSYEMIKSYSDEDSVLLLYYFVKAGIRTPMSQFFKIEEGKIRKILLVFDGIIFTQNL